MSSLCLEDNWRAEEEHYGKKAHNCDIMKVFVSNSFIYMKKSIEEADNQWSSYNVIQVDESSIKV